MGTLYFAFNSAIEFQGQDFKSFIIQIQSYKYIFPALATGLFLTASLRGSVAAYEIWPKSPPKVPELPAVADHKPT